MPTLQSDELLVRALEDGLTRDDVSRMSDGQAYELMADWIQLLWMRFPQLYYSTRPTEARPSLPGTPGKIEVMRERAAKRQDLFHPDDPLDLDGLSREEHVERNGRLAFRKLVLTKDRPPEKQKKAA